MATMTNHWTTYAVLAPSTPQFNKKGEPVEWKVQRNETGQWRCSCPSFIFCKPQPRTCKHVRVCQQDTQQPQQSSVPVVPTRPATWDSAYTICVAMVDQARLLVTATERERMVEVLAAKLLAFVPPPTPRSYPAATTTAIVGGIRRITFDDN